MEDIPMKKSRSSVVKWVVTILVVVGLGLLAWFYFKNEDELWPVGINSNPTVLPGFKDPSGEGIFTPAQVATELAKMEKEGLYTFRVSGEAEALDASRLPTDVSSLLIKSPNQALPTMSVSLYGGNVYRASYVVDGVNVWNHYNILINRIKGAWGTVTYGKRSPAASIIEVETSNHRVRILQSWKSQDSVEVSMYAQAK
jgi:hypothetical protein